MKRFLLTCLAGGIILLVIFVAVVSMEMIRPSILTYSLALSGMNIPKPSFYSSSSAANLPQKLMVTSLAPLYTSNVYLPQVLKPAKAPSATPQPPGGPHYFIDSIGGSDKNSGTSQSAPWKSLSKLASFTLQPGSTVSFKRGSSFGPLAIYSPGTAAAPITFNAYGDGNPPQFSHPGVLPDLTNVIYIEAPYIILEDLKITNATQFGVFFAQGAVYGVAKGLDISDVGTGIYARAGHTLAIYNTIHDTVMIVNDTAGSDNDYGAEGVVVESSNNEFAWNTFYNNCAFSYDYAYDGSAFEVFNASTNNSFHHNTSTNDANFLEVGSNNHAVISNFYIGYNKIVNDGRPDAILLHLGGAFSSQISGFMFYNNTVVNDIDQLKEGLLINMTDGAPNASTITVRNNIFVSNNGKSIILPGGFTHDHNLFYGYNGTPLGFTADSTDKIGDPLFANFAARDLHLTALSPALNIGSSDLGSTIDLDDQPVPVGPAPDAGSYEFQTTIP